MQQINAHGRIPTIEPRPPTMARGLLVNRSMAIRITKVCEGNSSALQVDGRLVAEDVDLLLQEVSEAPESTLLDLTHLQGTDEAGLRAILQLVDEGHLIVAASPYLKLQLQNKSRTHGTSVPNQE